MKEEDILKDRVERLRLFHSVARDYGNDFYSLPSEEQDVLILIDYLASIIVEVCMSLGDQELD